MLGVADLVDASSRLVTPGIPGVTVRVRSEFRRGSFDITFQLARAYREFVTLFSSNEMQAWATLLSILGISGVGLWQFMGKAKGRKPRVVSIERTEKVLVSLDGEEELEIQQEILDLFNHAPSRKAIEAIVQPLNKDGIAEMQIRKNGLQMARVQKDELAYYKAPNDLRDEQIFDNPNARLIVESLSFKDGNKWRFSDGARMLWARVEDSGFVEQVNTGAEAFRKGDVLHVTLRTRQWFEGDSLKLEHSILKVHRRENKLRPIKKSGKSVDQ